MALVAWKYDSFDQSKNLPIMVSERQDESKKERERGVSINLQKTFVTLLLIQNGKNTKELEFAVGSGSIMISLVFGWP